MTTTTEYDEYEDTTTPGTNGNGVDPSYMEQYATGLGDGPMAERRTGFEPVVGFPNYYVKPVKATGMFAQNGSPLVQVQVEILEGPSDTVGRKITDSKPGGIYFLVNRESKDFKTGEMKTLDEKEFSAKLERRKELLRRIKASANLAIGLPASFSQEALDQYAAQFENGSPFVIEIRVVKGNDGVNRNRLIWETIAAPNEPVLDKNKKPIMGLTALDEARKKIIERDKAVASKGTRGRTAGNIGRPATPTSY